VIVAGVAAAWLLLHRRPPQPAAELTQTRLTFNSSDNPVLGAAVSPDGKYLAYTDSAGIHVRLISTGDERVIPKPSGLPAGAYWFLDSWFPDGTQLLADTQGPGARHSMWTVSVLGQSAHELREGAGGWDVSPDGTRIAFSPLPGSADWRELWVMDSQGDNPHRVLGLEQSESFWNVHWAPDGERLAYTKRVRTPEKDKVTLETCDLMGANRAVVVPGIDRLYLNSFGWLSDGRIVYLRPDSPGSNDENLWQVRISGRTGAPADEPKRITQWAGSLWGLTASGDGKRLTFMKSTYQTQVYLGELTAGGARMSPPRRLTHDEADAVPTAWTADSKALLFGSNRNGAWAIFRQQIDQDHPEVLVTGRAGSPRPNWPRLSADGAWILYVELPASGSPPFRMMRIPVSGGVPQLVMETSTDSSYECVRGAGGLCVVLEENPDGHQLTLTAFNPLKGRGKVLRTLQTSTHFYGWGVSPDGTTLAFSEAYQAEIHIRLLSLSGGADSEITVKGWPDLRSLTWSLDGKGFYCGSRSSEGSTLLFVDLKGNAHVLWQFRGANRTWGDPSPDGRYLSIMASFTNSTVWMLEGF
jgi:Tol biopolymer transport system component